MSSQTYAESREDLLGGSGYTVRKDKDGKLPASTQRNQQLLQARSEMEAELFRLRSTAVVISDTSGTIQSINSQYGVYRSKLTSAANALKGLKKKMESDDKYIYWSYVFFLFTAVWIFLKRVKVIGITQWLVKSGYYGTSWIVDLLGGSESVPSTIPSSLPSTVPVTYTTAMKKPTRAVPIVRTSTTRTPAPTSTRTTTSGSSSTTTRKSTTRKPTTRTTTTTAPTTPVPALKETVSPGRSHSNTTPSAGSTDPPQHPLPGPRRGEL